MYTDEHFTKAFEVGRTYEAADCSYDPITILSRTEKTITVTNSRTTWKMMIKHDEDGHEYVVDSSVPKKWRNAFTYKSKWGVCIER